MTLLVQYGIPSFMLYSQQNIFQNLINWIHVQHLPYNNGDRLSA